MRNSCLLVLLLALLIASCGTNLTNSTPGPAMLDQNYTSADGTLTFNYPSGWVIRESEGQVFLATSEPLLASTGSAATVTPGQFALGIIVFPAASVEGLGAEAGPSDVASAFAPFLAGEGQTAGDTNPPVFGDPTAFTIGSRRAARIEGTSGADQALLIVLELEPGLFAILAGGSAPGELARFEPTLIAIAETMRYSSAEATQSPEATAEAGS